MRKLTYCFLSVLVLMLCACTPQTPSVTPTPTLPQAPSATPAPTASPIPVPTPEPISSEEAFLAEQIAIADACRVQTEDAEYYLDTSQYILFDHNVEFPLYRRFIDSSISEYMGTTGYAFQLCDPYIYIKSDVFTDTHPQGELTRVVDLSTGDIRPCNWNMEIFIPDEGDLVYYTIDTQSAIYAADPSLAQAEEFDIQVPERRDITSRYGDIGNLYEDITITGVADGWISFQYRVSRRDGTVVYEGGYRVSTDGDGLEKTDDGQFY